MVRIRDVLTVEGLVQPQLAQRAAACPPSFL